MRTRQFMAALACWAMATVAQAQSRGAVWVHGLGSNQNEWAQWAALFTAERQLNTQSRGDFTSEEGVVTMAGQVRGSYAANSQNIYFGHSMGGVVGRHIDTDPGSQNTFGAIITAGSAHDGARIANTAGNGELVNAVADGVQTMAVGPGSDPTLNLATGGLFVVAGISISVATNYLRQPAQAYLTNNFLNQSAQDFMEGSSYQNSGPRDTQTNTAKLLIYGNEESPVHWRLASEEVYQDERMVGWANTAYDIYSGAMWANYGIAAAVGYFTFGIGAIPFVYIAVQWSRGMNWVRYDSERIWNYLIGSGIPSSFTVCYPFLNQRLFADCLLFSAETPEDYEQCAASSMDQVCYTYYAHTNGQSDGLIKAPSQTGYNTAWANNAYRVEALGVNHLEMKKHPVMENIYRRAFEREFGDSFFTPRR